MAGLLEISGTASGNATLVGAWELRAGSHDTTEWLDGAADVSYPGGGTGTFQAFNEQADGGGTPPANGYDPAPKMALITLGSTTDGQTIILKQDGVAVTVLLALVSGGTNAHAQTIGATIATNTVTLPTSGTVTSGQLMVLYK